MKLKQRNKVDAFNARKELCCKHFHSFFSSTIHIRVSETAHDMKSVRFVCFENFFSSLVCLVCVAQQLNLKFIRSTRSRDEKSSRDLLHFSCSILSQNIILLLLLITVKDENFSHFFIIIGIAIIIKVCENIFLSFRFQLMSDLYGNDGWQVSEKWKGREKLFLKKFHFCHLNWQWKCNYLPCGNVYGNSNVEYNFLCKTFFP